MSTSSIKRQIRRFHVVVVQWTSKKCTKSVMHVQSCCFARIPPNGNDMNAMEIIMWNDSYFKLWIKIWKYKWKWSSRLNEQPMRLKKNHKENSEFSIEGTIFRYRFCSFAESFYNQIFKINFIFLHTTICINYVFTKSINFEI